MRLTTGLLEKSIKYDCFVSLYYADWLFYFVYHRLPDRKYSLV